MNANAITQSIALTKADAREDADVLRELAAQAPTPIDQITLSLAATLCQTAARHLAAAYDIARDYQGED